MSLLYWAAAALAEIAGCYAAWMVLRLERSPLWLLPGAASLAAFAGITTLFDAALAGRAYAAYGGVYIAASVLWLAVIEGTRPDRWDLIGASLSVCGTLVILYGRLLAR